MLQSLFNKVAGLQACNFIKKKLQNKCFAVKFAKFLRAPIFRNIYERLLLTCSKSNIEPPEKGEKYVQRLHPDVFGVKDKHPTTVHFY